MRTAINLRIAATLGLAAFAGLGLSGCKREPDFDAQYQQTQHDIAAMAKGIDKQIDARMSEDPQESASADPEPSAKP